jgi:hypothetical protein
MLTLAPPDEEDEETEIEVGDGSQRMDKKILTFKILVFDHTA